MLKINPAVAAIEEETAFTVLDRANWPAQVRAASFTDPELISFFVDSVPPTVAWLKAHGVKFGGIGFYGLTPRPTIGAPYVVAVDEGTLPANCVASYDLDGTATWTSQGRVISGARTPATEVLDGAVSCESGLEYHSNDLDFCQHLDENGLGAAKRATGRQRIISFACFIAVPVD